MGTTSATPGSAAPPSWSAAATERTAKVSGTVKPNNTKPANRRAKSSRQNPSELDLTGPSAVSAPSTAVKAAKATAAWASMAPFAWLAWMRLARAALLCERSTVAIPGNTSVAGSAPRAKAARRQDCTNVAGKTNMAESASHGRGRCR